MSTPWRPLVRGRSLLATPHHRSHRLLQLELHTEPPVQWFSDCVQRNLRVPWCAFRVSGAQALAFPPWLQGSGFAFSSRILRWPAHFFWPKLLQFLNIKHQPPQRCALMCTRREEPPPTNFPVIALWPSGEGRPCAHTKQTSKSCLKGKTGHRFLKRGQRTFDNRGSDYLFRVWHGSSVGDYEPCSSK